LKVECQELSKKLSQKSEQALELQGEWRELEEQVQELRKQGQMLVRVVVRQPAVVESLVSLLPPAAVTQL
jgi:phage shock protein A